MTRKHHVVIIGGGFGGLYAAQAFRNKPVQVTLIDKRNFHLFQPLLYQVATGGLSPGDIASPLRAVLYKQKNVDVCLGEVTDIIPDQQKVILSDGEINYDSLIVATGAKHSYFGNDQWREFAPGLKTVEDAMEIRKRIFLAFEAAEREQDPELRKAWMRFIIAGGGPTGVELSGALGELANHTLVRDFKEIDTSQAEIILVEGLDQVLPTYPKALAQKAEAKLTKLGVTVMTNSLVTNVKDGCAIIKQGNSESMLYAKTVLWAAGVQASPLGRILHDRTGVEVDKTGRVHVEPDLSIQQHPNIFIIGDLSLYTHQGNQPLPGVAPVAMQQGRFVARYIAAKVNQSPLPKFHYTDRGSLAVIGRAAAVANFGKLQISGIMAWFLWLFVHLMYLVEFDNRLLVFTQWAINYITRKRGARLITNQKTFNLNEHKVIQCRDEKLE